MHTKPILDCRTDQSPSVQYRTKQYRAYPRLPFQTAHYLSITIPDCPSPPSLSQTVRTWPIQSSTANPRTTGPNATATYRSPPRLPVHSVAYPNVPIRTSPRLPYHANTNLTWPKHTLPRLSMTAKPCHDGQKRALPVLANTALPVRDEHNLSRPCPAYPELPIHNTQKHDYECPSATDEPSLNKPFTSDPLLPHRDFPGKTLPSPDPPCKSATAYPTFCMAFSTSESSSRLRYFAENACMSRFALSNRFFLHCS